MQSSQGAARFHSEQLMHSDHTIMAVLPMTKGSVQNKLCQAQAQNAAAQLFQWKMGTCGLSLAVNPIILAQPRPYGHCLCILSLLKGLGASTSGSCFWGLQQSCCSSAPTIWVSRPKPSGADILKVCKTPNRGHGMPFPELCSYLSENIVFGFWIVKWVGQLLELPAMLQWILASFLKSRCCFKWI